MGARNEGRATGAIARMKAEGVLDTGSGQVVWLELDLSTPASTKLGMQEFIRCETRLDILGEERVRSDSARQKLAHFSSLPSE